MEAAMAWAIVSHVKWRRSRKRVARAAAKLLAENGDLAFFQAHTLAQQARGAGDDRQARFWQDVCSEISRQIQRTRMVADFLPRSMVFAQGGFAGHRSRADRHARH
jgi:hypothetical protein